jgi:hypothetical protein
VVGLRLVVEMLGLPHFDANEHKHRYQTQSSQRRVVVLHPQKRRWLLPGFERSSIRVVRGPAAPGV